MTEIEKLKQEFDSVGTKFNGLTWKRIEMAMEAYAHQQNKELLKQIKHEVWLMQNNRPNTSDAYKVLGYILDLIDVEGGISLLQAEVINLESENEKLIEETQLLRGALERIVVESEDNEQVFWQYVAENMVDIAKQALNQK